MHCFAEVNVDLISPSLTDQSSRLLVTKQLQLPCRIKYFPNEVGLENPKGRGANLLFGKIIPENCIKTKGIRYEIAAVILQDF